MKKYIIPLNSDDTKLGEFQELTPADRIFHTQSTCRWSEGFKQGVTPFTSTK